MRFESASEVQQQAHALLDGAPGRQDGGETFRLAHFAAASDPRGRLTARAAAAIVATGIAQKRERSDDFQLAVRYRHAADPGTDEALAHLRDLAHGEIDAQEIGEIRLASWHRQRRRPCCIGTSVGVATTNGAGTIGAFVRRAGEEGLYVLSNNHVLTDQQSAPLGSPVLQPGGDDGGTSAHRIGELSDWVPVALGASQKNRIDAAIARIDPDVEAAQDHLEQLGRLAGTSDIWPRYRAGERIFVHKIGRTTSLTSGRVTMMNAWLAPYFGGRKTRFENQLEIEGDNGAFGDLGDSGSLVVDRDLNAVGLFFATGRGTKAFANHLQPVLDSMQLKLAL